MKATRTTKFEFCSEKNGPEGRQRGAGEQGEEDGKPFHRPTLQPFGDRRANGCRIGRAAKAATSSVAVSRATSATAAAAPSRIAAMDFSDSAALAEISASAFAVAASRSFWIFALAAAMILAASVRHWPGCRYSLLGRDRLLLQLFRRSKIVGDRAFPDSQHRADARQATLDSTR